MNETVQGIVIQSIGGFYYVEAADAVYECRARGIFRKQGLAPVAGDRVRISRQDGEKGTLEEVLERRNVLVRPPGGQSGLPRAGGLHRRSIAEPPYSG